MRIPFHLATIVRDFAKIYRSLDINIQLRANVAREIVSRVKFPQTFQQLRETDGRWHMVKNAFFRDKRRRS